MARPREFDENEVLEHALETFWSKGFDGTSIQDLVESTGLVRASLYGAFGDKHRLYARVLEHYVEHYGTTPPPHDKDAPVRAALDQLLMGWVATTCPKSGPRGCFLVLAGTQGTETAFARDALTASLRKTERLFAELLRRGQERAEIPKDRDAAALARVLVVALQGIAVCARAGWGQERLRAVVDETLDLIIPR